MTAHGSNRRAAFVATLTPHRSLDQRGFFILMTALSTVSFGAGLAFAWVGAWPVLGFFGLDVLIVYVAFKLSYRSGRLYERVEIAGEDITLTRMHPGGHAERYRLAAYWARVLLHVERDGRSRLALTSHGREIPFGAFLTDDERESFSVVLAGALRRHKHGDMQGDRPNAT